MSMVFVTFYGDDFNIHLLTYKLEHIAISQDVTVEFLDYTRSHILEQAFKMNGNRYGWGGMLNTRDCSSFISALGTIAEFHEGSEKPTIIKTRTVLVNDLSVKRASGKLWMEALTTGKQIEN